MTRIPEHAKRVFEGKVFEVWQWGQEMFDGTVSTFENVRRPNWAKVIAVTPDKKILINQEEQPGKPAFMCLPGGLLEIGESMEVGATRELLEETWYTPKSMELLMELDMGFRVDAKFSLWIAHDAIKVSEVLLDEGGEKIEVQTLTWEEFKDLVFAEKLKQRELSYLFYKEYYKDPDLKELKKRILWQ